MKYTSSSSAQDTNVGALVRKAESDFTSGETTVSKYVQFSLHEDINKIYAYLESKHVSGKEDSKGRLKPFFNIVLAARNIWYRATDLDRKNVKIRATKSSDDVATLLATIKLQDWMRRNNFGEFLNAWGINSAGFNESVCKFVEQDGKLVASVVPWNRIICDPIDFKNNPKIELLELTEAQLRRRKGYDQELVEALCSAQESRETTEGQKKDNKSNYIKLYEVHGELALEFLTGEEDDRYEYVQQMHVISFVATKENSDSYSDYTLYRGKEEKDPYLLTALLPEVDGSIALRGSVKTLFDAQWMQNHTAKAIKDQLDLASKLIFQTSDKTFVGQNALTAIQTGDILIHAVNEPLTMLNNKPDIVALQSYAGQWKQLGNELVGISESMLGQTAPSGTAWRQVDALLNENHSLFELMAENKGLALETMLREFIIPHVKKDLDNPDEISAILEAHDISKIDARYIRNSATRKTNVAIKEKILSGTNPTQGEQKEFQSQFEQEAKDGLAQQGNQRFFAPSDIPGTTWKEALKDIEWDVEADITNENVDKDAMTTLNTLLQIITDPVRSQALKTARGRFIVDKILQRTGTVSAVELASLPEDPPAQPESEIKESISYKDAPPDIQRQMEQRAGMQPSQIVLPQEGSNEPMNE